MPPLSQPLQTNMKLFSSFLLLMGMLSFKAFSQDISLKSQVCHIQKSVITLGDVLNIDYMHQNHIISQAPHPGLQAAIPPQVIENILKPLGLYVQNLPKIIVIRDSKIMTVQELSALLTPHLLAVDPLGSHVEKESEPYEWLFKLGSLHIPTDAQPGSVEDIVLNERSRTFKALLSFENEHHENVYKVKVEGQAHPLTVIPVLKETVRKGASIHQDNITFISKRLRTLRQDIITEAKGLQGLSPIHTLLAGQPLYSKDFEKPILIRKNAMINIKIEEPGLQISLQGQAVQNGCLNEIIKVKNITSNKFLMCKVTGPDQAIIELEPEKEALE
jgi:flagellar basal body P-ring formation protein FlgA